MTPLWPNLAETPKILGANVVRDALEFGRGGWRLDVERLLAALTPGTRAVMINSPNNPTGWTLARDRAAQAILEHRRRAGIWIVADDVYGACSTMAARAAPSFLDLADPAIGSSAPRFFEGMADDGLAARLDRAPPELMPDLGELIEYDTSCSPVFVQRAGVVAIRTANRRLRHAPRFRAARDLLVRELASIHGVDAALPAGAMYPFFRVAGVADGLAFCRRWCAKRAWASRPAARSDPKAKARGWCFAADPERLLEASRRLHEFLARR